jgi:peptide/nickel transport system substrate-binding protein
MLRIPRKSVVRALMAGGAAGLLAAASAAGGSPAAAAAATPAVVTLSEGVQYQPNWWFPNLPGQYCDTGNTQMSEMAYRPLVWISDTDTINWNESVASGITVSHNDTVYTLHISSRFKWSNGQPVTAYDALYDAELLLHSAAPGAVWTACGAGIGGLPNDWKSVTAPNAATLVVTTTQPVNPTWFEESSFPQVYPIPRSIWDKYANWKTEERWILQVGVNPSSPQFAVIDGPYGYGPFSNDAYATLIANRHYTGPQPAHIKTLRFLYETSEANEWAAALRGTFAQVPIPTQYNAERAQLTARAGYQITYAQYGYCFNYAQPNFSPQDPVSGLLKLLYVRQAMEMAMNQKGMIALADNIGYAIYGPIPPTPKTVWYDPTVKRYAYPYNPAAGKALLERHGWHEAHGVMTNSHGQTLTFTLLFSSGYQWGMEAAELWQASLKQEGIRLNLQEEPFNQVITTLDSTHAWQIGWVNGWCYEPDFYPTGVGLLSPGASDWDDYSNPVMNRLLNATVEPGTYAQALQRMDAYQVYAAQQLPLFYMPQVGGFQATLPWLHVPVGAWNPVQYLVQYNLWYTTRR